VQFEFAVSLVGEHGAGRTQMARSPGAIQEPVLVVTASTPRPA